MYVNPILVGVVATLLVEICVAVVYTYFNDRR